MDISPTEAEEALAAIETMAVKTRHSIASGGTTITLIVTGLVWLVGFTCTQFLPEIAATIWAVLSIVGGTLGTILGFRRGERLRSPLTAPIVRRVGLFWLLLVLYGVAAIVVAAPADGKQATMLVILFIMLGHMAMSLVFSFSAAWWSLPIAALALVGYFLVPDFFYLWTAVLGGGGMIALGLTIRSRW